MAPDGYIIQAFTSKRCWQKSESPMTNDSQTAFLNPCVKFYYEDLNIATGETSQAIIPFHSFGNSTSTTTGCPRKNAL